MLHGTSLCVTRVRIQRRACDVLRRPVDAALESKFYATLPGTLQFYGYVHSHFAYVVCMGGDSVEELNRVLGQSLTLELFEVDTCCAEGDCIASEEDVQTFSTDLRADPGQKWYLETILSHSARD